jgi:hypothetical protein
MQTRKAAKLLAAGLGFLTPYTGVLVLARCATAEWYTTAILGAAAVFGALIAVSPRGTATGVTQTTQGRESLGEMISSPVSIAVLVAIGFATMALSAETRSAMCSALMPAFEFLVWSFLVGRV